MDVQFVVQSIKILLYVLCFTNIPYLITDQKVLGPEKPSNALTMEQWPSS